MGMNPTTQSMMKNNAMFAKYQEAAKNDEGYLLWTFGRLQIHDMHVVMSVL